MTAAAGSGADEYCEAIREAGAEPIVVTAGADRPLSEVDGLLVTGGGDVDPALYGSSSTRASDVDAARDAFEGALLCGARDRGLPTLCICRGVQIANVAFGGSLFPDLPAELGPNAAVPHRVTAPGGRALRELIPQHVVHIEPASSLARLVGTLRLTTGSRHHQAVARCASDLRVVARTEDGVVEALEPGFDSSFWLGVQWHPESTRDADGGASRRIFSGFVVAASRMQRGAADRSG